MGTEPAQPPHRHGPRELCAPGLELYERALRQGKIARGDLVTAPCLIDMALVQADPWDEDRMLPVPPSAALARLLQPLTREIDERIELTLTLARSLAPMAGIADGDPHLAITMLEGPEAIREAIREATAQATTEVLTAQPGSDRPHATLRTALDNARIAIAQGARLRHIYQHPARYSTQVRDYLHLVPAESLQVRTTELTVERLLIFDRTAAFIPATTDRSSALHIRHPALVAYLAQVYEVLWAQATPYTDQLPITPGAPVTAVQQSVARLLAEGHVDDVVARKLGISVRTCRSHISKLMQTLGAHSRTHLGVLLVRSGIADTEAGPPTRRPAPGA
ncbi:helix-turn-helix transcriptional regulator [Streptomyces salyersiae]|uniref:Helix-turn-helix transcriptional regulator n=1 Tax=Streptomyces salyersiae TaxID=3075530 RepID=A0ABU2RH31_9ACTN|nr:helix-turn-helix transcriptional regulator [Streptomyces sp. DSM 41770]MDT0427800.1 helix-turn-helix transcriptional regulator [Streptomyces sp. DSM 41770]